MRSLILFSLLALLSTTTGFAQERLWLKQSKIADIKTFETTINPGAKFEEKNVTLSEDYYPLFNHYRVTLPIVVQRNAVGYLPLSAEYFYTPKDSVLRLVDYDWEKAKYGNFFELQKLWAEEQPKIKLYSSEFDRIKAMLAEQLGTPTTTGDALKEVNQDGQKYYTRETEWDTATYKATLSIIFAPNTHRIRLTMYWKQ